MSVTDLWEHKHAPHTIEEMILHDSIRPALTKALKEVPNIILSGSAGVGKGTFIDILLKHTKCEYKRINGSDQTGVDTIRDVVYPFVTALGFSDSLNIMYINEADYLSHNAQAMLRDLMEQVNDISRFVFACNYHEKLIPELKSRCQFIHFPDPPLKEIAKHCIGILKAEEVEYEVKDVVELCKLTYPDIRHTINTMKANVFDGRLTSELVVVSSNDVYNELIKVMKSKDPSQVRKFLRSNPIDYVKLYHYLYEQVMDSDSEVFTNDSVAILAITEAAYRDSLVAIKEINFMNCYLKMMRDKAI